MDRLWSPWRYKYVTGESSATNANDIAADGTTSSVLSSSCVFCRLRDETEADESNLVVHRAAHNYVVLNLYPYTGGHLLVVPHTHTANLDDAPKSTTDELMDLAKRCQTALRAAYRPDGFNLGMNLGQAAGAGVAAHIHLHVLPRWAGDANFMTTIAETRVIPEDLATTYTKLRAQFARSA